MNIKKVLGKQSIVTLLKISNKGDIEHICSEGILRLVRLADDGGYSIIDDYGDEYYWSNGNIQSAKEALQTFAFEQAKVTGEYGYSANNFWGLPESFQKNVLNFASEILDK